MGDGIKWKLREEADKLDTWMRRRREFVTEKKTVKERTVLPLVLNSDLQVFGGNIRTELPIRIVMTHLS